MRNLTGTINKNFLITSIESIEIHDKNTGELLLSFDAKEPWHFINNLNEIINNGE